MKKHIRRKKMKTDKFVLVLFVIVAILIALSSGPIVDTHETMGTAPVTTQEIIQDVTFVGDQLSRGLEQNVIPILLGE